MPDATDEPRPSTTRSAIQDLDTDDLADELDTELRRLARLRHHGASLEAEWEHHLDELRRDHAELLDRIQSTSDRVDQSYERVRTIAKRIYKETGDKHPSPAVTVQERRKVRYDKARALEWAKDKGMFVVPAELDATAFEKHCRDADDRDRPDFVEIDVTPTPMVSTSIEDDLPSLVLEEE